MIERAQRAGKRYVNPVATRVGSASMLPKILWLYLTNKDERRPREPLGPFHTDPRVYLQPPASGLRVTWFGHSASLLEIDGMRVLVDPMWDERAAPVTWFGPRRFFAPTLPLDQLPRLDLILLSHDHYDHLGAQTVKRLIAIESAREARWVTSLGVGRILRNLGVEAERISELDWTQSARVGSLTVTALPARHFSGRSLSNRNHTLWSSFSIAGPQHRVYYGADSGEWEGFREIAARYGPFDLTMLEIGASNPLWADIHMGPEGAYRTFLAMGARGLLMPVHWALFELAPQGWREPIERILELSGAPARTAKVKLWLPEPGLPTDVEPGVGLRSDWWKKKGQAKA